MYIFIYLAFSQEQNNKNGESVAIDFPWDGDINCLLISIPPPAFGSPGCLYSFTLVPS